MYRLLLKTIPLCLVLMLSACKQQIKEKVVSYYENDQPAKVHHIDCHDQVIWEVEYYEDGAVKMEGGMKNGKREGEWKAYFQDGKVQSEGIFRNGLRTGKATVYHPNGNLYMEGFYKEGHHCGKWTYYDEQGYVVKNVDYGE